MNKVAAPIEDRILDYLDGKTPARVERLAAPILEEIGTNENSCLQNVERFVVNNTHLKVQQSYGWTVKRAAYLLHSVVRYPDGRLECITPSDETDGPLDHIYFIEDPAITEKLTRKADGIEVEPLWNGETVPMRVWRPGSGEIKLLVINGNRG